MEFYQKCHFGVSFSKSEVGSIAGIPTISIHGARISQAEYFTFSLACWRFYSLYSNMHYIGRSILSRQYGPTEGPNCLGNMDQQRVTMGDLTIVFSCIPIFLKLYQPVFYRFWMEKNDIGFFNDSQKKYLKVFF